MQFFAIYDDPRVDDFPGDTPLWAQLLAAAYCLDGGEYQGLSGALNGIRCLGAALVETESGVRMGAGDIDPREWVSLRQRYLLPHARRLTDLLTELLNTSTKRDVEGVQA